MDKTSGAKRANLPSKGQATSTSPQKTKDRGTASNKQEGLSADQIEELALYPELYSLLNLHHLNQKVKEKNLVNQDKIGKLKLAFKDLGDKVKALHKEQSTSKTVAAVPDPKKDDKKGAPGAK